MDEWIKNDIKNCMCYVLLFYIYVWMKVIYLLYLYVILIIVWNLINNVFRVNNR